MTAVDWTLVYGEHVVPVVERLSASPPPFVWALLAVLALVGVLVLVFVSGGYRLTGLVPIGVAGFIGLMLLQQNARADLPARYRIGVVQDLRAEQYVHNNSNGTSEQRTRWVVELRTTETGYFDQSGTRPVDNVVLGVEELSISEPQFQALEQGEEARLVSYPGAEEAVGVLLTADGAVL